MKLRSLLIGTLCVFPGVVSAQVQRRTIDETAAWLAYIGIHPISPNWRLQLEGQLRQLEGGRQPQQRLFRTALLKVVNPAVRYGAGYAFNRSYPPDEFVTNPIPTNEHRSYLQFDLNHAGGIAHWDHRYRLEQRWVERLDASGDRTGWTYTNRARYFLRSFIAPGGGSPGDNEPYFVGFEEVFVSFGKNVRNNIFDQNRLFLGAGYKWSRALSVEAGYMSQIILRASGTDVERNHMLFVGIVSGAPLRKF